MRGIAAWWGLGGYPAQDGTMGCNQVLRPHRMGYWDRDLVGEEAVHLAGRAGVAVWLADSATALFIYLILRYIIGRYQTDCHQPSLRSIVFHCCNSP